MTRDERGHVGERLDAWRTGELEPADRERVETHLAECERCREELAALEPLAAAFERGFAARRREAADREPDWAAQRAAIVARTSGRRRAGGGRPAFWRWAPQIAAAALAVIVVGIVWHGAGPESPQPARVEAPIAAGPGDESAASSRPEAESRDRLTARADEDAADEKGQRGEAKVEARPEAAAEAGEQEVAPSEQYRAGNEAAALADRVEPAAPGVVADLERFERQARAALSDRDPLAARRALALWGDTLAPRVEADGATAALADSLEALLEAAE